MRGFILWITKGCPRRLSMKYETKIDIVSTDGIIKYDNCAKKIFSNKEIMAVRC